MVPKLNCRFPGLRRPPWAAGSLAVACTGAPSKRWTRKSDCDRRRNRKSTRLPAVSRAWGTRYSGDGKNAVFDESNCPNERADASERVARNYTLGVKRRITSSPVTDSDFPTRFRVRTCISTHPVPSPPGTARPSRVISVVRFNFPPLRDRVARPAAGKLAKPDGEVMTPRADDKRPRETRLRYVPSRNKRRINWD